VTAQNLPIDLNFDDGIDRKTLRRLRGRFLVINRQRWERARSSLTYRQQVVLEILPLVFHLNHPSLPGYTDAQCPYGLSQYRPADDVLNAARRLARTFSLKDEGRRQPDLDGLFLMGSPGTLGHSVAADLDIWLCHRPDLGDHGIACLERKANRLGEWAHSLGVELHVFVFSADDFRERRQRAEVTGENCGSAQHYLLLDEFYRTGIYLGGRYPLWWLVPPEDEHRYADRTRQLIECRFVRSEEYIDFGAVPSIPREEFLGAGVWQLYKGIDAPWKTILKLLLIECYALAEDRPLLSKVFKQAVFAGITDADRLDPYLLLYERLEQWLTDNDAGDRLNLVRQSLYLKSGLPLTRINPAGAGWRAKLLDSLVTRWQWSKSELSNLDNRARWRAEDVMILRRQVVAELTHSYRLLSRLAREQGTTAAISHRDMNLLGRKLYAAFQRKAGKIELINPGLAPSLAEENLSFHHQAEQGDNSALQGWMLYRDLEEPSDALWQPVIRRSGSLTELMVWCFCNGLLTRSTRLNVRGGPSNASMAELQDMLNALAGSLPMPVDPVSSDALSRGARPLRHLLFVNVGVDPQSHLTERGLHKLSARHDSLGFSGGRENLVMTIDQVTYNSWHEVSLQHYAAGDTLIQCLKNILASAAAAPDQLPEIRVQCHSAGHGVAIARRVQELFSEVMRSFFVGGDGPHPLRYIIEMDRRYFVLSFNGTEPGFIALESHTALLECLARPQESYLPVVFDQYAMADNPRLKVVCHASEPGSVQVFYGVAGDVAQLWVVDELGGVLAWQQSYSSRRNLLVPLLRFLENLLERKQLRQLDNLAWPTGIKCYELTLMDGEWQVERRPDTDRQGITLPGLEVQAVGVKEGDVRVRFDIFCADREFTVQEYGDQLIPAVAHYIRSLRRGQAVYPVYLTDVHLPHDLDPQIYQQDIQTIQYLYYRIALEESLNRFLAD